MRLLFDGVRFGDLYKTRGGALAVYMSQSWQGDVTNGGLKRYLISSDDKTGSVRNHLYVDDDGRCEEGRESRFDIVGKWRV